MSVVVLESRGFLERALRSLLLIFVHQLPCVVFSSWSNSFLSEFDHWVA